MSNVEPVAPPAPEPLPDPRDVLPPGVMLREDLRWTNGSRIIRGLADRVQVIYGMPVVDIDFDIDPRILQYAEAKAGTLTSLRVARAFDGNFGDQVAEGFREFTENISNRDLFGIRRDDTDWDLDAEFTKFQEKLVLLLPEALRFVEVVEEVELMPLLAAVARGEEGYGLQLNGVAFTAEDVTLARKLYQSESEAFHQRLTDFEVGMSMDPQTGETMELTQAQQLAADVLTRMQSDSELDVQLRVDLPLEESKIASFVNGGEGVQFEYDEQGRLMPTAESTERMQNPGAPGTFDATIGEDGGVVFGPQTPLLTSEDVQRLFRIGMMDWEGLAQAGFPDPATGQVTARPEIRLGEFGEPTAEYDVSTGSVNIRHYTPSTALTVLYQMKPMEIGNLQDKLTRAGYMPNDGEGIIRNDPTDPATMQAWKMALSDAMRSGENVEATLRRRVRQSPLVPKALDMAQGWASQMLNRKLNPGEERIFQRYVTDWNRRPATANHAVDLGSQIEGYLDRTFRDETDAMQVRDASLGARGLAKAWAREHGGNEN